MSQAAYESLHALSGAYVVDAVDDAERAAFEAHLPQCRDCREEVASLREAAAVMTHATATQPPASLRASVRSGISTVRPLPPEVDRRPDAKVIPLRRHRLRLASVAAAAAVAAAVTVGVSWQPWEDSTSQTLTAADRVLAASDATHVSVALDDGAQATVVRSESERRAVLVGSAMSAPPSGKVLELWLRDSTGEFAPAGLVEGGGDHKVMFKGDAAQATAAAITVEPEGGSKHPTSKPVAVFDFDKGQA